MNRVCNVSLAEYLDKNSIPVIVAGSDGVDVINIEIDFVRDVVEHLKNSYAFSFLIDIAFIQSPTKALVYHLRNLSSNSMLRVVVEIRNSSLPCPSLKDLWVGAYWKEREIFEIYGIKFDWSKNRNTDYQNRLESTSLSTYMCGPYYSSLGAGPKLSLENYGGTIKRVNVETGFFRKGLEQLFETKPLELIAPYIERLNCDSSIMCEVAWFKAIESILGIEISDRSKVLRMIFMELTRISGHLQAIANVAKASGNGYLFLEFYNLRNKLLMLFQKISGRKFNMSMLRIGGLAYDLPKFWLASCCDSLLDIEKALLVLDKNVIENSVWIDRLSIGTINRKQLLEIGVTGPMLRASGVNFDLRKRAPCYYYRDIEFDIPLGNMGTCYDLFLVRVEEVRASCKILAQLIDNVPVGNVTDGTTLKVNAADLPTKDVFHYSSIESVNGELGFFIIVGKERCPKIVKCVSPSFRLANTFEEGLIGLDIEDVPVFLASLSMSVSEMDR